MITVGKDVWARALGISWGQFLTGHQFLGVKFCPGIGFLQFHKHMCNI